MLESMSQLQLKQASLREKLLKKNDVVTFSSLFPGNIEQSGKTYEIQENIIIPYTRKYILPCGAGVGAVAATGDYKDVDLSNSTNGEHLYPQKENTLYEILFGLVQGNYLVLPYAGQSNPYKMLEYTGMEPLVTDTSRRYVGATMPSDSPVSDPMLKIYAVKDMIAFILRLFVLEGMSYEAIGLRLWINKCRLGGEIKSPSSALLQKAKKINYYEEERW